MKVFLLFLLTKSLIAEMNCDALRKQNEIYQNRIKVCKIQNVPYFYTGNISFSGRACIAMALSALLSPDVITVRDINILMSGFNDDLISLSALYKKFKIDFKFQIINSLESIKREIEKKRLVILEGFFSFKDDQYQELTNKILIFGFDQYGLIVHDPCGQWLGFNERKYDHISNCDVFKGRENLYLFRDLRQLLSEDALICFQSVYLNDSKLDLKNDFRCES